MLEFTVTLTNIHPSVLPSLGRQYWTHLVNRSRNSWNSGSSRSGLRLTGASYFPYSSLGFLVLHVLQEYIILISRVKSLSNWFLCSYKHSTDCVHSLVEAFHLYHHSPAESFASPNISFSRRGTFSLLTSVDFDILQCFISSLDSQNIFCLSSDWYILPLLLLTAISQSCIASTSRIHIQFRNHTKQASL